LAEPPGLGLPPGPTWAEGAVEVEEEGAVDGAEGPGGLVDGAEGPESVEGPEEAEAWAEPEVGAGLAVAAAGLALAAVLLASGSQWSMIPTMVRSLG
jgi:hypothetical protein